MSSPALSLPKIFPRAGPVLAGLAVAAAVAVVGLVDPNQPGTYPTCPFLALTGRYCPGCGALRAVHALVHGRLLQAVDLNALLVLVGLPVLAALFAGWTWRMYSGRPRSTLAPPQWLWAFTALVLAFWLLRNLPVGAVLAP